MEKIKKKFLGIVLFFVLSFAPNSNLIVNVETDYDNDDEKQLFI